VRFDPATDKFPCTRTPDGPTAPHSRRKDAGLIFELHPATKNAFGIKGNAALFDIDIEILLNASRREKKFDELARFPDVPYEISVIADRTVYAETIADIIRKTNRERIRSVSVFSVYEGAPIPEGKKSVSYRIIFAAKDATLASQEIESLQKSVLDALQKKGFTLR
jgi:phenylalanyl-tRNA synthetase beta chain